ncbi:MAG: hypothetical protein M1828_001928 [Chrysothrix sp. TS-e1954]|nr:MAG: hypothetical protein M1828_001928 [Chrysothrix sp. TS-e1954]
MANRKAQPSNAPSLDSIAVSTSSIHLDRPTFLLWSHQLKREHTYLLERINEAERTVAECSDAVHPIAEDRNKVKMLSKKFDALRNDVNHLAKTQSDVRVSVQAASNLEARLKEFASSVGEIANRIKAVEGSRPQVDDFKKLDERIQLVQQHLGSVTEVQNKRLEALEQRLKKYEGHVDASARLESLETRLWTLETAIEERLTASCQSRAQHPQQSTQQTYKDKTLDAQDERRDMRTNSNATTEIELTGDRDTGPVRSSPVKPTSSPAVFKSARLQLQTLEDESGNLPSFTPATNKDAVRTGFDTRQTFQDNSLSCDASVDISQSHSIRLPPVNQSGWTTKTSKEKDAHAPLGSNTSIGECHAVNDQTGAPEWQKAVTASYSMLYVEKQSDKPTLRVTPEESQQVASFEPSKVEPHAPANDVAEPVSKKRPRVRPKAQPPIASRRSQRVLNRLVDQKDSTSSETKAPPRARQTNKVAEKVSHEAQNEGHRNVDSTTRESSCLEMPFPTDARRPLGEVSSSKLNAKQSKEVEKATEDHPDHGPGAQCSLVALPSIPLRKRKHAETNEPLGGPANPGLNLEGQSNLKETAAGSTSQSQFGFHAMKPLQVHEDPQPTKGTSGPRAYGGKTRLPKTASTAFEADSMDLSARAPTRAQQVPLTAGLKQQTHDVYCLEVDEGENKDIPRPSEDKPKGAGKGKRGSRGKRTR